MMLPVMGANSLPLARDQYTGQRVGKYELLCHLATGGMSELVLAFQRGMAGFQKVVVIKRILPHVSEDSEFVRLFLDEARIVARFNHPNIVQVFDLDLDGQAPFVAMEFVAGAALHELWERCSAAREPAPVGLVLAAARDVALALHYAHTRGDAGGRGKQVIHRDVAPKNIMVSFDGRTKLLDFGIAKVVGGGDRTAVGRIRGSLGYMSPEQMYDGVLGPATDIFSLGVVLYEGLTDRPLYTAGSLETIVQHTLQRLPAPSQVSRKTPAALDATVLRALAFAPKDRYSTALELARAIEKAGRGLIWTPDKCGAFARRFFAERYQRANTLLDGDSSSTEVTGQHQQPIELVPSAPMPGFEEDAGTELIARAPVQLEPPVGRRPTSGEGIPSPVPVITGAAPTPIASAWGSGDSTLVEPSSRTDSGSKTASLRRPERPGSGSADAAARPARSGSGSAAAGSDPSPRPSAPSPRPSSTRLPQMPEPAPIAAPSPSLFFDPVANPFKAASGQARQEAKTILAKGNEVEVDADARIPLAEEQLRPLFGGSDTAAAAAATALARAHVPVTELAPVATQPPPPRPVAAACAPAPAPAVTLPAPKPWLTWALGAALVVTIALWILDRFVVRK